jgi:ubiquinone/menaquinone biosynthesis C-methylase UbiE
MATGVYRRINRESTLGLPWKRRGDFVTFEWGGFVEAPSIPALFARHHYETSLIRRLLGEKNVQRSLELGCGYGRLSPTFASLSAHHTAIDIDPVALAAASTAYPHLDFRQSNGVDLPFADGAFDLVVTWTVLQHVPPERIDGLSLEIMRVLAPEGRILLCEETRDPGGRTKHSWHREPSFYEERFAPLRLTYSSYIDEIDRMPELISPGRVMLFEPVARAGD